MPPAAAAAAAGMGLLALLLATLAAAADPSLNDSNKTVVVTEPTSRPVILQSLFDPTIEALVFSVPEFVMRPDAWQYISLETRSVWV